MTKNTLDKVDEFKIEDFRLKEFVTGVLRRSYKKTPMYGLARAAAKHEYIEYSKHGKPMRRVHYKCALCGRFFNDKPGERDIAVDHIDPIIRPDVGFEGFDVWIPRHFLGTVQVLCNYSKDKEKEMGGIKSCHKAKTAEENKIRTETKKRLKEEAKTIKTKKG